MSLSLANIRLFTRLPTLIRTSRMNATTTTSSNTNRIPPPKRPDQTYTKIAALTIAAVGILALIRASRREEQLIAHTVDHQHEPPVATSPPK